MEVFWIHSPIILVKHFCNIFPNNKMFLSEKLNVITRLLFIMFFIGLAFRNKYIMLISLILIISIVVYYYLSKEKYENCHNLKIKKDFTEFDIDNIVQKQPGIIPDQYKIQEKMYGEYDFRECRIPTFNNLYNNPILTFNNDNYFQPYNVDDNEISDGGVVNENANRENLYKTTTELYDTSIVERIFYSGAPVAVPPDTVEFAKFLNKIEPTCREDQSKCLEYEDLRYKNLI